MSDAFRFCPVCGGALESRSLKAGDPDRLICAACGFVFYLDPKVAVGTIIGDAEGRILLVRRAIEPGYGKWVFPGGYVDRGEQVLAAAQREAREECGLAVRVEDLVDIYSYPGRTPIIIVFAATLIGGDRAGRRGRPRSAVVRLPAKCRGPSWRSEARTRRFETTSKGGGTRCDRSLETLAVPSAKCQVLSGVESGKLSVVARSSCSC